MADLRPLKPRRFGDGGLMVTVTGFQSVTAGSLACCEGIDAVSEQVSSCDKELLSGITTGESRLRISVSAVTDPPQPARSRTMHLGARENPGHDRDTGAGAVHRHCRTAAPRPVRQLAANAPVHRIMLPSGEQAWLITNYAQARRALHDPRLVESPVAAANVGRDVVSPEVFAAMANHMLNLNPPDHTRLRRLVTTAFTRRRIEQLAPRIQQITDELLDAMATETPADLITSFALSLPIAVICELVGVPATRREELHDWSFAVVTGVLAGPDVLAAAITALVSYLRELVEIKRATPADDLLSALVAARDGQDRLSDDELTSMVFLILVAGHETTVNLIGNGVLALLTHPDQWELLRAEPDRLPAAVEELLRFDGPLQVTTPRRTAAPVGIGGVTVPADEIVLIGLVAANRDPAATAHADALDITRTDNPHLAFGHGIHHCLGAPLARLEGRIALGNLLSRFPQLRLAVPVEQLMYRPGVLMNGLTTLPVILR